MAACDYLGFNIFLWNYQNYWNDLCKFNTPDISYDDFLTGMSMTYATLNPKQQLFSDYATQLYSYCLSGSSSGHAHTDTYWTASTVQANSIVNSGLTSKVGIGTDSPEKMFHIKTADNTVAVFESTDNTCTIKISDASDDAFIVGKNNMLYISDSSGNPNTNAEFAFDYVNGRFGVGTTTMSEQLTVAGNISASTSIFSPIISCDS